MVTNIASKNFFTPPPKHNYASRQPSTDKSTLFLGNPFLLAVSPLGIYHPRSIRKYNLHDKNWQKKKISTTHNVKTFTKKSTNCTSHPKLFQNNIAALDTGILVLSSKWDMPLLLNLPGYLGT